MSTQVSLHQQWWYTDTAIQCCCETSVDWCGPVHCDNRSTVSTKVQCRTQRWTTAVHLTMHSTHTHTLNTMPSQLSYQLLPPRKKISYNMRTSFPSTRCSNTKINLQQSYCLCVDCVFSCKTFIHTYLLVINVVQLMSKECQFAQIESQMASGTTWATNESTYCYFSLHS